MRGHFPRPPKRPLKRHMSQVSWQLVQQKQALRTQANQLKREHAARTLRFWFRAWNGSRGPDLTLDTLDPKEARHPRALCSSHLRRLSIQVTASLRKDDKNFFDQLASAAGEADSLSFSKALWKTIRWTLPKFREKKGPSPLLLDALDSQWLQHFASLEAGSICDSSVMIDKCLDRQECRDRGGPLALQDLPTLIDVEKVLRKFAPRKAAGPDGLSPDLFRLAAASLAPWIHDLYTKATAWQMEPLQGKGGKMIPIMKRGDVLQAASYRGIMVLNVLNKGYHSWLRSQLMHHVNLHRDDLQLGGFAHQQSTFGVHYLEVRRCL